MDSWKFIEGFKELLERFLSFLQYGFSMDLIKDSK